MTFNEYREIIDDWTELVKKAGIKLSNNSDVPVTFWKTFFGIKRKVHQGIYNGKYAISSGEVPIYLARTIELIQLIEHDDFIAEVKKIIPVFELDKTS